MADTRRTVAAIQLTSGVNQNVNVARAVELVTEAIDLGATYVQLPEYFNYYGRSSGFAGAAESIPGPATERFAELAASRGVAIHLGSMLERSDAPSRFYNTSVLIADTGEIVATYRKAHLFDVDVAGEVAYRESDAIDAGDLLVVADVAGFRLGLSICFDVRFPELYRELALRGAHVFALPAAFAAATGRVHWDVLVRARAIENHAFVIAATQVGTTGEGLATWGHSMIVGPWGEVLAASSRSSEDVVVATIDLDDVARRRSQIAVFDLRRPDLYDAST